MKPFESSNISSHLTATYLSADTLRKIGPLAGDRELFGIVQQWMTEGIPYLFRDDPLLYEGIRNWLAVRLNLNAKELTLIGSGRLGFSLKADEFGRPFSQNSDLDFTAVSSELFEGNKTAFNHWRRDFDDKRIFPKNSTQHNYWDQTFKIIPRNIIRGFIDPHLIPNRYEWPSRVAQTLFTLRRKLELTPSIPSVRKISIRVYNDWAAFMKQMQLNLSTKMLQL